MVSKGTNIILFLVGSETTDFNTYFLQLQSTIIQVKHVDYQETFFQLGLWNSYQETEKAHANLKLIDSVFEKLLVFL